MGGERGGAGRVTGWGVGGSSKGRFVGLFLFIVTRQDSNTRPKTNRPSEGQGVREQLN